MMRGEMASTLIMTSRDMISPLGWSRGAQADFPTISAASTASGGPSSANHF